MIVFRLNLVLSNFDSVVFNNLTNLVKFYDTIENQIFDPDEKYTNINGCKINKNILDKSINEFNAILFDF